MAETVSTYSDEEAFDRVKRAMGRGFVLGFGISAGLVGLTQVATHLVGIPVSAEILQIGFDITGPPMAGLLGATYTGCKEISLINNELDLT